MSTDVLDPALAGEPTSDGGEVSIGRHQWLATLGDALRYRRTRIGLWIVGILCALIAFGPLLAPHSPTEFVGAPNVLPSTDAPLGTDALGRDVLSRVLYGGRSVLGLALLATAFGVGLGAVIGLTAAYARGVVDDVLMRVSDVFMAFPQIVFGLLLVSALGPKLWLLVLAVGITHAPRVARVLRGAALEVSGRDFVRAAELAGETRTRIILSELLPNVSSPLLVEAGLRLTFSIGLVAALSFLGFGLQPPAADWGLMINENRLAIVVQPWSVVVPVAAIGLLTVGTNLITDGIARAAIGIDRQPSR